MFSTETPSDNKKILLTTRNVRLDSGTMQQNTCIDKNSRQQNLTRNTLVLPEFAFFLGLSVHEHMISETWHRFQALLMTLQKILQFGQKLFAFSNIGKLNDEVMIFDHTDHNHGFLIGVLERVFCCYICQNLP